MQLLERGCPPDACGLDGRTALMVAAAHGHQVGTAYIPHTVGCVPVGCALSDEKAGRLGVLRNCCGSVMDKMAGSRMFQERGVALESGVGRRWLGPPLCGTY